LVCGCGCKASVAGGGAGGTCGLRKAGSGWRCQRPARRPRRSAPPPLPPAPSVCVLRSTLLGIGWVPRAPRPAYSVSGGLRGRSAPAVRSGRQRCQQLDRHVLAGGLIGYAARSWLLVVGRCFLAGGNRGPRSASVFCRHRGDLALATGARALWLWPDGTR
jgi:hypothetical protein